MQAFASVLVAMVAVGSVWELIRVVVSGGRHDLG